MYVYVFHCNGCPFCISSGHLNNCHCLAKAINQLAGALFYLHGPGDTEQRLQEFLAVRF